MATLDNPHSQSPSSLAPKQEKIESVSLPGMEISTAKAPVQSVQPDQTDPSLMISDTPVAPSPAPVQEEVIDVARAPSSDVEKVNSILMSLGHGDKVVPVDDGLNFNIQVSWDNALEQNRRESAKAEMKNTPISLVPTSKKPEFQSADIKRENGITYYRMGDDLEYTKIDQNTPPQVIKAFNEEMQNAMSVVDLPSDAASMAVDIGAGMVAPGAGSMALKGAKILGQGLVSGAAAYLTQGTNAGEKFASHFYDPAFIEFAKKNIGKTSPDSMAVMSGASSIVGSVIQGLVDESTIKSIGVHRESKKIETEALKKADAFAKGTKSEFGIDLTPGQAASDIPELGLVTSREIAERQDPLYRPIITKQDEAQFAAVSNGLNKVRQDVNAIGTTDVRRLSKTSSGESISYIDELNQKVKSQINSVIVDQTRYALKNGITHSVDDAMYETLDILAKHFPDAVMPDGSLDLETMSGIKLGKGVVKDRKPVMEAFEAIKSLYYESKRLGYDRFGNVIENNMQLPKIIPVADNKYNIPSRFKNMSPARVEEMAVKAGINPQELASNTGLFRKLPFNVDGATNARGAKLPEIDATKRYLESVANFQKKGALAGGQSKSEEIISELYGVVSHLQLDAVTDVAERRGQKAIADKFRADRVLTTDTIDNVRELNKHLKKDPSSFGKQLLLSPNTETVDLIKLVVAKDTMDNVKAAVFDNLEEMFLVPNPKTGRIEVDGKGILDLFTNKNVKENMISIFGEEAFAKIKRLAVVSDSISRVNPGRISFTEQEKLVQAIKDAASYGVSDRNIRTIARIFLKGQNTAQQTYFNRTISDLMFEAEKSLGNSSKTARSAQSAARHSVDIIRLGNAGYRLDKGIESKKQN